MEPPELPIWLIVRRVSINKCYAIFLRIYKTFYTLTSKSNSVRATTKDRSLCNFNQSVERNNQRRT